MTRALVCAAAGLVFCLGSVLAAEKAVSKSQQMLVGKWENQDAKEKGTLEFHKNGKVTFIIEGAPEIEGTYKWLKDDTMQVNLNLPGGQKISQKLKVKVTEDELTTTDEKGKVDKFTKATK